MARWWHLALAITAAAAVLLQVVLVLNGGQNANVAEDAGAPGEQTSEAIETSRTVAVLNLFSYFTIQSNLLVIAAGLLVWFGATGRVACIVRADAFVGIVVTGVVFGAVLLPLVDVSGWGAVANAGLHYVTPLAMLVVLFLGPRFALSWPDVAWSMLWPVAWLVLTFVRGAFTDFYPYPFLDVAELGFGTALVNTAFVVLGGGALFVLLKVTRR